MRWSERLSAGARASQSGERPFTALDDTKFPVMALTNESMRSDGTRNPKRKQVLFGYAFRTLHNCSVHSSLCGLAFFSIFGVVMTGLRLLITSITPQSFAARVIFLLADTGIWSRVSRPSFAPRGIWRSQHNPAGLSLRLDTLSIGFIEKNHYQSVRVTPRDKPDDLCGCNPHLLFFFSFIAELIFFHQQI